MKHIKYWMVISVFLLSFALTGAVLAASNDQQAGPGQPENKTDGLETASSMQLASVPEGILSTSYVYTNSTPLAIPDAGCSTGVVTSTLTVTDSFLIGDLDVGLWVPHTYRGDLELWLTAPNGTQITLLQDQGSGGDNLNVLFDESSPYAADALNQNAPPPYYYIWWNPVGDLSLFNGMNAQGTWTVAACDDASGDTGTLTDWTLFFTSGLVLNPAQQGATDCKGSDVVYDFSVVNTTALTQSFSLAYTSVWPSSGPASTPVLGVGETWSFQVTHHIPWAATAGDQDTLQVDVAGGGDSDSATATTTAALVSGWQDYSNVPTDRGVRGAAVVYWDGKLYKIGGYGYIGTTGAARAWLDIYDIASDTWTTGADMLGARYWLDCEAIDLTGSDPKIYCGGGYTTAGTNTLYIYDINTNTWSNGAPLPANRYNFTSAVYNNKYYLIGGYTTAVTNSMVVYDPATDTWDSSLASMSVARRYAMAGVIGGQIYVAGGYSTTYLSSAEVYDIALNTWTPVASMPSAWLNAADGVVDDRYLVLAGGASSSSSAASNGALIYDSLTDTWNWLPLFNHMIYSAEGAFDGTDFWVVSGRLYENGSFLNSPYTTKMLQCAESCTPLSGADFTFSPTVPRPTIPATFTATLTTGTPPISFDWDFGDGGTGSGQVVEHAFALAGTYSVTLEASNCDGAGVSAITRDVVVEAGPIASVTPSFLEADQCPNTQTEQTVNVCNNGDSTLEWTLNEVSNLLGGPQNGIDSLSGSFVVFDPSVGGDTEFTPGTAGTFCFRAETSTTDYEYRLANWLRFPSDWTVTNAYLVGTPVCDSGTTWGTFNWYYETAPFEIGIDHTALMNPVDHCVATYCVDATTGASGADAAVSWYWNGDGWGGPPHHPCSSDQYTPPGQIDQPCDEWVNPQALIPAEYNITWLSEEPLEGTVAPGACEVITVTFDSTALPAGLYTGTLEIETNDTMNPLFTIPVSLDVAGPPTNPSFTYSPSAPIIGQEVAFSGYVEASQPVLYAWDFGDGATDVGQFPTHAYGDYGTYEVTMTATQCGEQVVYTDTVTVEPCFQLVNENFEASFPPVDWSVVNNGGTCVWTRNDAFATPRPNYAGGDGFAADADSDKCGSGSTMDTELRTMSIDLSGVQTATLEYMTSYNDIGAGGDVADVDVSIDGGATWTNLLHWDADHSPNGPGELVDLDLTPYAGYSDVMLRYHYWVATYDWWWEVDQVNVVGCLVPGAQPEIAVEPLELYQELRTNQTAEQTFNIANNGLAWLNYTVDLGCGAPVGWLSADPLTGTVTNLSDVDITATFDSSGLGLGTYQTPVCVLSNDPLNPSVSLTATLLITGTPDIAVDLPVLDVELPADATTTLDGTICNVGDGPLNWTLSEAPGLVLGAPAGSASQQPKAQPEIVRLPDGSVDCAAYQDYVGYEPAEVAAACPVAMPAGLTSSPQAPTDIGYAQDIGYISDNFVSFTLDNFSGQTVIGTNAIPYYGMDFDPAADVLYALNDTTDMLGTIDLTTGAFTPLVACPPGGGAANWTGLSIDPVTGVFYGSTATSLFIIDPATGSSTLVGDFGTTLMIDIAINMQGEMYGHDIGSDSIYSIDMTTGAATLIGLTGYLANYAQGMDFDNDDGTLYIFLYIGSGANVYGTVNLATGAVTPLSVDSPLGEFEGATQTAGFSDIPWLSETPTSGTLQPGECIDEYVTFDSTGLSFGSYTGALKIESTDPFEPQINLPVTLTVLPEVEFVYYDLEDVVLPGEAVYLAGDFTGWLTGSLPMIPNGDSSVFTLTVPVSTGTHEYKYVVYTDTLPSGPEHWDWLQSYPDGHNRMVDVSGPQTVEDYRDIVPGWWVLQWPPAITTTVHIPTESIYGQVWAYNLTWEPGPARGLLAELGYGTEADPGAWATWASMPWSSQEGENDQYADTILPEETGVYSYAVRFNGNWGAGNPNNLWYYGDTNGNDYNPNEAGVLTVIGPSITLAKTVGTDPDACATSPTLGVEAGTTVYYCYTVTNTSLVQLNVHSLYDDQLGDLLVDFAYGLNPGASAYITASAVITQDVTNTATWTAGDGDTHFAEASDSAMVNAYAIEADLRLDKLGPSVVRVGEEFSYVLRLENLGPQAAVNVVVQDTLPDGLTIVSMHPSCLESGGVITCDLAAALPVDEVVMIEIVVIAPADPGFLSNTAVVSSDLDDPDESNNTSTIETEVLEFYSFLPLVFKEE